MPKPTSFNSLIVLAFVTTSFFVFMPSVAISQNPEQIFVEGQVFDRESLKPLRHALVSFRQTSASGLSMLLGTILIRTTFTRLGILRTPWQLRRILRCFDARPGVTYMVPIF